MYIALYYKPFVCKALRYGLGVTVGSYRFTGDWNLADWKMTGTKMPDYTNTVSHYAASNIFC